MFTNPSPVALLSSLTPLAFPPPAENPRAQAASKSFNRLGAAYEVLSDKDRRRIYDVYGMAGLKAGLEVGHRHKTIAEISEEFEKARAKEARERIEAKLNFRGTYGFSFSAAHLVDAEIARRRRLLAMQRGITNLSPLLDLNGMDFNSVFDIPLGTKDVAYVGAQGQIARGMGGGGLVLGLRRQCSAHTSVEATAVTGNVQSAANLSVQRQLSEHSTGSLTYSYNPGGQGLGLEVGVQRQLSNHSKGHLTWNVGPVGGMSTGMSRSKGKTSWKFDLLVGLAATGITGLFARKLSKRSSFRVAFRCGSMAMDVDLGCTRRMSPETMCGLSVKLGLRGIHINFRFNHNGQRFNFPVLISPTLTPLRVLCSLAVPTLLVAATKKYVVKPAALRMKAVKQAALREKHAESVRKDKAEAAEAVSLLEVQTEKRMVQERARGGLVIEAAVFGHFPQRAKPKTKGEPIVPGWPETKNESARGDEEGEGGGAVDAVVGDLDTGKEGEKPVAFVPWLDVTTATRFMVFDSHLDLHEGVHKAGILGFCDPCPGEEKFFRVRYRYRGRLHEVTVGEEEGLGLPNKSHELPANLQTPEGEPPAAARSKSL